LSIFKLLKPKTYNYSVKDLKFKPSQARLSNLVSPFSSFTFFYKSYVSKKNYSNFFMFKTSFVLEKFSSFLSYLFKKNTKLLFFSNNQFKYEINLYNAKFNKFNSFYFNINYYFSTDFYFNSNFKVNNFFKLFKGTVFYVIDSYFNRKILFFLRKLKRITIGVPFNKFFYNIITWPIFENNITFIINQIMFYELYFFKMTIFLQKKFISSVLVV